MIRFPDEDLVVAGVRGPLKLEDILLAAKKANRVAPLQVVRADRVVGVDHLRSAARHAKRAFDEERNHADRMEVEFTRYVAGERQIRKAIEKMGIPDGHDAAILCAFGDKAADAVPYFIDFLGLVEDDAVIDASPDALDAFGITADARDATDPDHILDLALEAVAAVDLMRK